MESKTFKIPNISCGHCVMTIEHEISELEGVVSVKAMADTKMVTVDWNEPACLGSIEELLKEINYSPEN